MGGPRVTEITKKFIIDVWIYLGKSGKEPSAKRVLSVAEANVRRSNRKDIFLPKLRKVQNILKEARKESAGLSPADKAMQEPWSLATLDKYPIPPEAIPAILDIWRYSVNLGEPLTIRQAKWSSRLYAQIKDTIELLLHSKLYSHEEELSLLSRTPMRIFDLDSTLVMRDWEVQAIKIPEWIINHMFFYFLRTYVVVAEDGGTVEEFFNSLPFDPFNDDLDKAERSYYLISLISALPSSEKLFPDIESRFVYLRHLYHLSQGSNWNNFTPEEYRDIIIDLRNWVLETKNKIDEYNIDRRRIPYPYKNIRFKYESPIISLDYVYPLEIYKRAGCEIHSWSLEE